jgi:hypothetical protein
LAILRLHLWKQHKDKEHQPTSGPYFKLPTLKRAVLANCCTQSTFPVELRFAGKRVGGTHLYSGYAAADMGSQSRDITALICRLELAENRLWLRLRIRASPLHTVGEETSDPNDRPESRYDFAIPVTELPLVMDMRPSEAQAFEKRLGQAE